MWTYEIDGADLVVRNVTVTAFGGVQDVLSGADNGETESGVKTAVKVDGVWTDTWVKGCALPIRSIEAATRPSPLAFKGPHLPWKTLVKFWEGAAEPEQLECNTFPLLDNGPNVSRYPTHAADLTKSAAAYFSDLPKNRLTSDFSMVASFRIMDGARWIS